MTNFERHLKNIILACVSKVSETDLITLRYSQTDLLRFVQGVINQELKEIAELENELSVTSKVTMDTPIFFPVDLSACHDISDVAKIVLYDTLETSIHRLDGLQQCDAVILKILNLRAQKNRLRKAYNTHLKLTQAFLL